MTIPSNPFDQDAPGPGTDAAADQRFARHRQRVETVCTRAGLGGGAHAPDGDPLVRPMVASTAFASGSVHHEAEHAYSRVSNPTVSDLEWVLGELENAPPAVCFASGMAAETALMLTVLEQGDHVVCGRAVYGGTTRLLRQVLGRLGIEHDFVDATRPEAVAAALRPRTRLVFLETPANPTLELTDIAAVSTIAREAGALVAVDNTFLTPVLQQPLDLGADVTVSATTKFVEGHSTAVGGSIVSRDVALLERLRFTRKCTGGIQTPFNAWQTIRGIKTLPIRLDRQGRTAVAVARWLRDRLDADVAGGRVLHPALDDFPQRALADRQHLGGHGAVVTFDAPGGLEGAVAVVERLRLARLVEHVGSVETLVTHPATMTHAEVPDDQRRAAGLGDGLLRLSIGLEAPASIIEDLDQAIAGAARVRAASAATTARALGDAGVGGRTRRPEPVGRGEF